MKYTLKRVLASGTLVFLMMAATLPCAKAQEAEIADIPVPTREERKESLKKYIPEITGEIKVRFEWLTNGGQARFNVRNARLRANGYVNPHISYRFFLDFHDQGNITILDAYVVGRYGGWEFVMGQQRADLDRSVNPYFFANRSFLIKFLTSHYAVSDVGNDAVNIMGWRDIGLQASYRFGDEIPARIAAGIFNGSGMNDPQWQGTLNYVGRVEVGHKLDGVGFKAWYYGGTLKALDKTIVSGAERETVRHRQKVRMAAAGVHYAAADCYFEGEYGFKNLTREPDAKTMHTAYIQGIYAFRFPERVRFFRYAAPVVRWDYGANIDYLNAKTGKYDRFSGHRATVGLNFGFIDAIMISELRFNYEKFLFGQTPADIAYNSLIQDKFTVELCLQF